MLNLTQEDITPNILVLWAMRVCVSDFSCSATINVIRDWFGANTEEFVENVQLIYWANCIGGDLDCRFLPCINSWVRFPESLLLEAIEAQMEGDMIGSYSACLRLAGNLADFAQNAIMKVSNLMYAVQGSNKPSGIT